MNKNERNKRIAYDIITAMALLALILFFCRLLPLVLIVILGIFIGLMKMLFQSLKSNNVKPVKEAVAPIRIPTEEDVNKLAYSVMVRRISELVEASYPEANWIWESSRPMEEIENGNDLFIMTNRAGGFRKAKVVIKNFKVIDVIFCKCPETSNGCIESDCLIEDSNNNYELLAFEWVEAHAIYLNEKYNEAIAQSKNQIIIPNENLPVSDSWECICLELNRIGLKNVECIPEGIKINIAKSAERE